MGEVVALRSKESDIYRMARAMVWKALTKEEQKYVIAIEEDRKLMELFHALEHDYRKTGWFVAPAGLSPFETNALHATHRFADELVERIATLREVKAFVDDFNHHRHHMPG
jgi:hypothetical protein